MGLIHVTNSVSLDQADLSEQFVRASGPGGQNVNKVASACQLRFDLAGCQTLAEPVKRRLRALAGSRLTEDDQVVIDARNHRTQRANRDEALRRMVELVRSAARKPKARRPTVPTMASRKRRLEGKKRRGQNKRLRRPPGPE